MSDCIAPYATKNPTTTTQSNALYVTQGLLAFSAIAYSAMLYMAGPLIHPTPFAKWCLPLCMLTLAAGLARRRPEFVQLTLCVIIAGAISLFRVSLRTISLEFSVDPMDICHAKAFALLCLWPAALSGLGIVPWLCQTRCGIWAKWSAPVCALLLVALYQLTVTGLWALE